MSATTHEARVREVFSDEVFVKELFALETPEKAQAMLKAKGVDVSIEELKTLSRIMSAKRGKGGELSAEAMDSVAGGSGNTILPVIIGPRPPVTLPVLQPPRIW